MGEGRRGQFRSGLERLLTLSHGWNLGCAECESPDLHSGQPGVRRCLCLAGGVWAGRRARRCLHKGHWAAWVQRLPGKARAREADEGYGQVGEDSAVQAPTAASYAAGGPQSQIVNQIQVLKCYK